MCSERARRGGNESPPDEYEAVAFDTTRALNDDVLVSLIDVAEDGTLRFSGTPDALKDLAVDQVIVGGISEKTPNGLLRLVTGVQSDSQGLVLQTVPTCVQMAFKKLHVKLTRSIPDLGSAGATARRAPPSKDGARKQFSTGIWPPPFPVDYFAFNGDDDPLTEDDQVHVTGTLGGGLDYTFSLDVDWGAVANIPQKAMDCAKSLFTSCSVEDLIPEAVVDFGISSTMKADITQEGVSFLSYTKDIPVYGPVYFDPIPIGLVVFVPEFEISSKIVGEASSNFALSVTMEATGSTGVVFSNKSAPQVKTPVADVSMSAPQVDATLDAYSKVRLGPEISLKLYGFAGPRAGLYGFAELTADQDNIAQSEPCFTLHGGVEGELSFVIGVDFPIFGPVTLASWDLAEDLWNEKIKTGDCTGGSNVQENPLQNPTFSPWSQAYGNTVVTTGMPLSAPEGRNAWTDLKRTIDGDFVIAGSGSKGLVKIDAAGQIVWSKRFIGPTLGDPFISELLPDRVAPTGDAAMFVTAYPWVLLKVDASGDLIWGKQFSFEPNDSWRRTCDIVPDGDGGAYLAAGYGTNAVVPLDVDTLVARLDADAQILWMHRIGDSSKGELPRLMIPFDDGIVVAGTRCDINAFGSAGGWRLWTARLDPNGTILWKQEYPVTNCGSSFETDLVAVTGHETENGDLILGGIVGSSPQRSFLAKIKPDGSLSFLTAYEATHPLHLEDLSITSLSPLPTSGFLATGTYLPYPYSLGSDLWIASLDSIGKFQWIKRFTSPASSNEPMPTIIYTNDGGALAAGYTEALAGGGRGFWTLKAYAKDGTITMSPSAGVTVDSIGIIEDTTSFCPSPATGQDWTVSVQSMQASLDPIEVTVENLAVPVTPLAP